MAESFNVTSTRGGRWGRIRPAAGLNIHTVFDHKFGRENVIDKKLSGHRLLDEADIVGCCTNSEMGLIALAKGKTVYTFDLNDKLQTTYCAIYKAVWGNDDMPSTERFIRLLSAKYSGIIPYFIDNPKERIDYYFNFWKANPHEVPRPRK